MKNIKTKSVFTANLLIGVFFFTPKVFAINNPPVLNNIEATALGYTYGNAAKQISENITVADIDFLVFSITGEWDEGTGARLL
jgi:hypothetical protein